MWFDELFFMVFFCPQKFSFTTSLAIQFVCKCFFKHLMSLALILRSLAHMFYKLRLNFISLHYSAHTAHTQTHSTRSVHSFFFFISFNTYTFVNFNLVPLILIQMAIRSAGGETKRYENGIWFCVAPYITTIRTLIHCFGSFHRFHSYLENHFELQLHCVSVIVRHHGQWNALK